MIKDSKEFKTQKLVEYFTDKKRIDVTDKNYESAIKLDKMICIYNKDIDSLSKYYQMTQIFKTSSDFGKEYKYLKEFLNQSSVYYIDVYVEEIVIFLRKIERGLSKDRLKELVDLEKDRCFEDYPYAAYYVNEYINYNESPYLRDFLDAQGLFESDFNRFLAILSRFDDVLYDQYEKKARENRLSRQLDVIRKIDNIRSGVTTGYTKEGVEFDKVEFFANLPFDDMDSSKEIIEDFEFKKLSTVDKRLRTLFENLCFADLNAIMEYIHTDNLVYGNPTKVKESEIYNTRYTIKEKELTEEDKKTMIDYMKKRKIPFLLTAFSAVKNQYVEGKLKPVEEKKLKKADTK